MAPAATQLPPSVAVDALHGLSSTPTKHVQNVVNSPQVHRPTTSKQNGPAPKADPAAEHKPLQRPTPALIDRFIDEPRPVRVAVIGGGLAGVLAGVLLPKKVPGIQLIIYEKNADFVRPLTNPPTPNKQEQPADFGHREEHGPRTSTLECDVTFPPMSTSRLSRLRETGATSSRLDRKFSTTGGTWLGSTMSTNTPNLTTESRTRSGTPRKVHGLSP